MHDSSYKIMGKFLEILDQNEKLKVLDVGSLQYESHKTYRELCSKNWEYVGLDLEPGSNVDVVPNDPYKYPFPDNEFDVIISGQCFEHVDRPWDLVKELYRILKYSGHVFIIAPSKGPIHTKHDCWRILPDGMISLLEWGGFDGIVTLWNKDSKWGDCVGYARKV